MSVLTPFLLGWAVMAVMMTVLWLIQRARRDAGVVDVGWAAGVGILALLFAALSDGPPIRRVLVAVLACGWSFRLALHLLRDRVIGHEEDGRYQRLRADWGRRAQPLFFLFFQAQGLIDVVLAIPLWIAMRNPTAALGPLDLAAVLVWITAVAGETIADAQLARFRADPANRGRTCRTGLWRFSRHPNYFFEWLHWWAYVLLSVGAPWGALSLIAPALMLWFLFKITGIPATEARALVTRGDDYRDYQRTTSPFVPWFPRGSTR